MPQLELADFPSQIFWLIVTFSFLYFVLAKISLPGISSVLKSRQWRISDDLEKAEKLKQEAQEAEQDFTSALADARSRAGVLIAAAVKAAGEEEARQFARLDETFEKQAHESEMRVKALVAGTDEVVVSLAAEAATAIAGKIAGVAVKKEEAEVTARKILAAV